MSPKNQKSSALKSETIDQLDSQGNIDLPKNLQETKQYKILAVGPFAELRHQCSGKPWQVPKVMVEPILKAWQKAINAQPRIWAGPQYRLEKIKKDGKTLTVETSLLSYNIYVGARNEKKLTPIAQEQGCNVYDLAAQPLNVSTMIVLADGKVPVQKRSLEVDVDPGMVYLFGGQLRDPLSDEAKALTKEKGQILASASPAKVQPEDLYTFQGTKRQAVSPLKSALEQIEAETGIPTNQLDINKAILLGLIQAKGQALHPELVFVIPTTLSSSKTMKLKGKDAWEGKLHLVSANPTKIIQEIKAIGEPVPILAGTLALYAHFTK